MLSLRFTCHSEEHSDEESASRFCRGS